MLLILGLILIGLVLLFFEIFLPGGILGFLSACCLLGAIVLIFTDYGFLIGLFGAITILFVVLAAIWLQLKWLPKTRPGSAFFLKQVIRSQTNTVTADDIIGKPARVLNILAPTGKVTVAGKCYEAFSQDGFIEKGTPLRVAGKDTFRIIVEKAE